MQKIISVNLAGRVLPISEDAWQRLHDYFDELRQYFRREADGDEILQDLESRMAELLSDRITVTNPTLQLPDVESAIAIIGSRADFEKQYDGAAPSATTPPPPPPVTPVSEVSTPKRKGFYRNSNDKFLGGVCSGIAHYLGLDPLAIRVLMVLLLFTGWGILGYLIIWGVAPEAPLEKKHSLRLYRSRTDKWLGGVCGGLASEFGKETWIFRLILLIPVVFGIGDSAFMQVFGNELITGSLSGTIVVVYILLWILLPLAKPGQEQQQWRQSVG